MNYPAPSVVPADSGVVAMADKNPDCPFCGGHMIVLNRKTVNLMDLLEDGTFQKVPYHFIRYHCRKCRYSLPTKIPERYKNRMMTWKVAEWIRDYPGFAVDAAAEIDFHPNTVWKVRQELSDGKKAKKSTK
jgi:hypothetical protein